MVSTQRLFEIYGARFNRSWNESVLELLNAAVALLYNGKGDILGPTWAVAVSALRDEQAQEAFEQHRVKQAEADALADANKAKKLQHINVLLLERRASNKSGFVGVYRNGRGWRGSVSDPVTGSPVVLETRDSPEEAAWDRYLWHRENNVAYSLAERAREDQISRMCSQGATYEEALARVEAMDKYGKPNVPLPPAEFAALKAQAMEKRRAAEADSPPRPSPLKPVAQPKRLASPAKASATLPRSPSPTTSSADPMEALAVLSAEELEALPLPAPKPVPIKYALVPSAPGEMPMPSRHYSEEEIAALPPFEQMAARVCSNTYANIQRRLAREAQEAADIAASGISDEEEAEMMAEIEKLRASGSYVVGNTNKEPV